MISRRRIEAFRHKLPGRRKVRLYSIRAVDQHSEKVPVPAEWRPVTKKENQTPDATGEEIVAVYAFWEVELKGRVLREGDVVEDLKDRKFFAIDSLSVELMGARIVAQCYQTVCPTLELDE